MGVSNAPTAKGKEAARDLRHATAREERKVEAPRAASSKKGEERFEERSKSSDGKSAGDKQR